LQYSTNERVSFSVEIGGMEVEDILYQGQNYQRLVVPGQRRYERTGFPEIPVLSQLIAIPDCEEVKLTIIPMDSLEFKGYNVYPVPELVRRYSPQGCSYLEEEFTINDSVYSVNSYFPNTGGEIEEFGYIREQRVARVVIYPVQFNPVAKSLRVYPHINVQLNFLSPSSAVIKDVGPFYKACKAAILNYR